MSEKSKDDPVRACGVHCLRLALSNPNRHSSKHVQGAEAPVADPPLLRDELKELYTRAIDDELVRRHEDAKKSVERVIEMTKAAARNRESSLMVKRAERDDDLEEELVKGGVQFEMVFSNPGSCACTSSTTCPHPDVDRSKDVFEGYNIEWGV